MAKIRNFDSFGGCIPTFSAPINVKFGTPCQISRLSGQRVTPAGENPIFWPLRKNNTGMAALRAGLPVNVVTSKLGVTHPVNLCTICAVLYSTDPDYLLATDSVALPSFTSTQKAMEKLHTVGRHNGYQLKALMQFPISLPL